MSEQIFITVTEAGERVSRIAERVLEFLAEFNATYPDPDANVVSSHFDFFTPRFVFQTCASALSEKLVATPPETTFPITIRDNADTLLQFSKGKMSIFPKDEDKIEAG
jgi:hypothetical protein